MSKKTEPCEHQWRETELYCEDCGDHSGVACDDCSETYDRVWQAEEYDKVIEELEKREREMKPENIKVEVKKEGQWVEVE